MDIQRLRNLTTCRMHTELEDIFQDLGSIIGDAYLMPHMLQRVQRAVEPWLRQHVTDPRFWDGEYDTSHVGELELPVATEEERRLMWAAYFAQPDPLD